MKGRDGGDGGGGGGGEGGEGESRKGVFFHPTRPKYVNYIWTHRRTGNPPASDCADITTHGIPHK
jgi:hypothetical protein